MRWKKEWTLQGCGCMDVLLERLKDIGLQDIMQKVEGIEVKEIFAKSE